LDQIRIGVATADLEKNTDELWLEFDVMVSEML